MFYSSSPRNRNRVNRNHLDICLSVPQKNRNSLTWVLVALTVRFTYPVLYRFSAESRAGEWESEPLIPRSASIQYRVGKTHCQGHQDPSKRVPLFFEELRGKCQDGSYLPGSYSGLSYCSIRFLLAFFTPLF